MMRNILFVAALLMCLAGTSLAQEFEVFVDLDIDCADGLDVSECCPLIEDAWTGLIAANDPDWVQTIKCQAGQASASVITVLVRLRQIGDFENMTSTGQGIVDLYQAQYPNGLLPPTNAWKAASFVEEFVSSNTDNSNSFTASGSASSSSSSSGSSSSSSNSGSSSSSNNDDDDDNSNSSSASAVVASSALLVGAAALLM